jgi:transcriptional regulator with XRE-family HTH domain
VKRTTTSKFGEVLEMFARRRGLSRLQISLRAGLSPAAVNNLVNRGNDPQLSTARKIAAVLGVTLAEIDREMASLEAKV